MSFGQRLRQLRLERRINQRELAARVGIDFTYLSKIENERMSPPAADTIVKLARALQASTDELLLLAHKRPSDIHPFLPPPPTLPAFLPATSDPSEEDSKALTPPAKKGRARRTHPKPR